MSVSEYKMGRFDLTSFWEGKRFPRNKISKAVRLTVENEHAPCDYVANPISWPICSQTFLDLILRFAERDVQVFDAPLFTFSGKTVRGYFVLNCIRLVKCLDKARSKLSYDGKEIAGVIKFAIKASAIPSGVHVFRVAEFPYRLFFSDTLAQSLVGKGVTGLAFIRCKAL